MTIFDPLKKNAPIDYKSGNLPPYEHCCAGQRSGKSRFVGRREWWLGPYLSVTGADAKDLAPRVVDALTKEDYISGIFVNDALGDIPGALPLSAVDLKGSALTPQPSILVNFASHPIDGCKPLLMCAAEMADTSLGTGQGMHGTFSRADTRNFMAALLSDQISKRISQELRAGEQCGHQSDTCAHPLSRHSSKRHPQGPHYWRGTERRHESHRHERARYPPCLPQTASEQSLTTSRSAKPAISTRRAFRGERWVFRNTGTSALPRHGASRDGISHAGGRFQPILGVRQQTH